jgi:hypothetical protein
MGFFNKMSRSMAKSMKNVLHNERYRCMKCGQNRLPSLSCKICGSVEFITVQKTVKRKMVDISRDAHNRRISENEQKRVNAITKRTRNECKKIEKKLKNDDDPKVQESKKLIIKINESLSKNEFDNATNLCVKLLEMWN